MRWAMLVISAGCVVAMTGCSGDPPAALDVRQARALAADPLLDAEPAWAPFPEADPALLVDDTIEIPVQVNGKVRARITVAAGLSQDDLQAAAHADPQVADLLASQTIRKAIAVKDKLVNSVVG